MSKKDREEHLRSEQEELRLKEWENNFDQEQKIKEEEEMLKVEKLSRREKQGLGLKEKEKEEQILEGKLTSSLEAFDIEKTKKN